jgi:thioredoxin reductase (NADPH)
VPRPRDLTDVVIIGGGIAGLTAAVHATRRGLSATLIEREVTMGGQVSTVNVLHDWAGIVSGVELATTLAQQARDAGVRITIEPATALAPNDGFVTVTTPSTLLQAQRVVLATGAALKPLGVPGEEKLRGKGVSQCAHCDGHFLRNEDVVVVGGGDAALQEALVLAEVCRAVTIVVRGALRARRAYIDRAAALEQVRFLWESEVVEILGSAIVTGVRVHTAGESQTTEIACVGVFPFIGVSPNTECIPGLLQRDAEGAVLTDRDYRTNVSTTFAVGAVRSGYRGDLISAAGEAASAIAVIADDLRDH